MPRCGWYCCDLEREYGLTRDTRLATCWLLSMRHASMYHTLTALKQTQQTDTTVKVHKYEKK